MAGLDLGRSINISLISSQPVTERKPKGDLLLLQMIACSYFYYQQRHRENSQDGGRIR